MPIKDKPIETRNSRRRKNLGYQLVPRNPTYKMLKALAGDPLLLAASAEAEFRQRYFKMLEASPVR